MVLLVDHLPQRDHRADADPRGRALVSQVATGLIATANKVFDLKADSSIQVILVVVLFGIGTDYILFFLFRYRERLREGEETRPPWRTPSSGPARRSPRPAAR